MKVKLNLSLPAVAVTLSMMAMSGYAQPSDSHQPETRATISVEDPLTVTPVEKARVAPEVTANSAVEDPLPVTPVEKTKAAPKVPENLVVENPPSTSDTRSATDSSVSKWLEARATEDAANGKFLVAEPLSPVQDPEIEGAGWCDLCGCWVRHGCDPNGNCNIMHISICGSGMGSGCYLHAGGCYSSS